MCRASYILVRAFMDYVPYPTRQEEAEKISWVQECWNYFMTLS
jgi:hypothetical protein